MENMKKFIKQKIADGLSTATIDSYCYALRDYIQWCIRNNITTATPDDIEDYFIYLRGKNYSQATLRDKYSVLHAYYNYCVQNNYINESPIKIKKPTVKTQVRCFTDDEIYIILKSLSKRETFTELRDYTIVCLLLSTGIRRQELLDIQQVNGDFLVVTGKGNKTRCVPISSTLRAILKKYLHEREKIACCSYLIITRDGHKMTKNGLRAVFTRLAKNTGIAGKRFSPHTFRHYFASSFLRNNGDLYSLQLILGHSNINTTSIYLHFNNDSLKNINEKCNPLSNFRLIL